MRGWSQIHGSGDFINKLKNIDIPQGAIIVTADVLDLYPSTPHDAALETLRQTFDDRLNKRNFTDDLNKAVEFVLINNFFEFN